MGGKKRMNVLQQRLMWKNIDFFCQGQGSMCFFPLVYAVVFSESTDFERNSHTLCKIRRYGREKIPFADNLFIYQTNFMVQLLSEYSHAILQLWHAFFSCAEKSVIKKCTRIRMCLVESKFIALMAFIVIAQQPRLLHRIRFHSFIQVEK